MTSILHKLRALLLSPRSKLELWLRTCYHRLLATHIGFFLLDWQSRRSYNRWRVNQNKNKPSIQVVDRCQPKVTFLLGYSAQEMPQIESTLESLINLTNPKWEVILFPVSGEAMLSPLGTFDQDERIKGTLILSPDQITGDFLVFCSPGDRFSKYILAYFYSESINSPGSAIYYYDCEYQTEGRSEPYPFMKPEILSPELILSVNYYSRGFISKTELIKQGLFEDITNNHLTVEYGLVLYLIENAKNMTHIPQVLVFQERLATVDNTISAQVVRNHLDRMGQQESLCEKIGNRIRFSWHLDNPSVAIIIPTKNHPTLLENLILSILEKTEYQNFTINLVDNESNDKGALAYNKQFLSLPQCALIPFHQTFNYSNAINLGVAKTESDLVLFLNDDMEVIDPHWLSELVQWVMRPEIGVVGTKLIRKNHTIQHAGIILGLNNFAGHIYLNAPEHYEGLFGSVDWYRDYLAVTGACQMVRREVFEEVGGYDEKFSLAFGDIDFCLKVHEAGYTNMYTPFATLFHYEGQSRGYSTPVDDIINGYERLESYLKTGDPYYSPNLTYTSIPRCNLVNPENRLAEIERRRDYYRK